MIKSTTNNMTLNDLTDNSEDLTSFFSKSTDLPYNLILFVMILSSLRPDKFLPGADLLGYLPYMINFVLFAFWVIQPQKRINKKQTKLFFLYVALLILHIPFARHSGLSTEAAKSALIGFSVFLVFIQFCDTPNKIERYIRLSIILEVVKALYGMLHGGKIHSIPALADENDFSLLMNTLIPFAFFFAQEAKSLNKRILYYLLTIIFILANISSFSRGGFIGLLAVGLYCLIKSPNKLRNSFIIVFIISIVIFSAPQEYWKEMQTINSEAADEGTGKTRIDYWKAGWRMFLDNPVFGVGPQNYGIWLPEYHSRAEREWGRVAHSIYFTLLPELGLTGTAIYLFIVIYTFKDAVYVRKLYRKVSLEKISFPSVNNENDEPLKTLRFFYFLTNAIFGSMIAYFVTGIFLSVLYYPYFFSLVKLMIVVSYSTLEIENFIQTKPHLQETS